MTMTMMAISRSMTVQSRWEAGPLEHDTTRHDTKGKERTRHVHQNERQGSHHLSVVCYQLITTGRWRRRRRPQRS